MTTVLEAFIRLAHVLPGLSLAIAGVGEDEAIAELLRRAAIAGVGERVEALGFVEHAELPELYRSADLLAAPSLYEGGMGMVYLEAMACGLPVVASAAGGAAEAIVSGETGVLLERGDAEETAAAIAMLLRDGEQCARMGAAGRARVQARFAPAPYAARVAAAYERAIERRRAAVALC